MLFTNFAYAMSAPAPGASTTEQLISSFIPLVMIIVIFYFLLIRPQQKKAKEHKSMQSSLKPGDRIVTSGGFFGRIVEINDIEAVVDLGEVKVTVMRSALSALSQQSAAAPATKKAKK